MTEAGAIDRNNDRTGSRGDDRNRFRKETVAVAAPDDVRGKESRDRGNDRKNKHNHNQSQKQDKLEGEANDYLGKGLSGGRIAVLPPVRSNFDAEKNTIAGNTLLYGATDGEVYINGRVGERFAVRNSGVTAVVEGVGDHCCEYMTGGRVVVLGETGRNFAAGMSGGVAYVWNKNHNFDYFCNMEMVELSLIEEASYRKELHELIRQHYLYTGSKLARTMLDNWNRYVDEFIQVVPIEYKRVLQEEQMRKLQQKIADVQRDY